MPKPIIPMRPANFSSSLTDDEQNAIVWHMISGCARKDAFVTFIRPDMAKSKSKAAVEDYVRQFFSRSTVKEFMDAYETTVDVAINGKKKEKPVEDPNESIEDKRVRAMSSIIQYVLNEASNIENAEDPKAVLDYANRVGLFDEKEKAEEEPRRYLPATCGSCRYRMFCEENTEDECRYCRYRAYSEEHGVHFEANKQLDKPFGTVIEDKKDVD